MEESSVSYGTPTNGASPGANPILAQPPLPDVNDQNEGMAILSALTGDVLTHRCV
jgi:hypothetical protein